MQASLIAPYNMNLFVKLSVVTIFFFPPVAGWAGTQEEAKVVEQPSVKTTEPWVVTVGAPGWLAAASGHIGFHGVNPYVSVHTVCHYFQAWQNAGV